MISKPGLKQELALRFATLIAPPAGLVLLWRTSRSRARKVLGTAGILLYCPLYALVWLWLMVLYGGLKTEWRGGYVPRFTYHPTEPDYFKLDADRRAKAKAKVAAIPSASPAYWTGFRGPGRDGRYDEMPIHTNWDRQLPKLLWKQPCGGGYASFAAGEGLVFTIEQRREEEVAVAYDPQTGWEAWTHRWKAHFDEPIGGDGPRATPSYQSGSVYFLGAEGHLRCLAARDGREIWSRNIVLEARTSVPTYGISSSPLLSGNNVIVTAGGAGGRSIIALDQQTGEIRWTSQNDEAAYSSPILVTLDGKPQIVVAAPTRVFGITPDNDSLLWEHPWSIPYGNRNVAQPVVLGPDRIFISGGYGAGNEALEITSKESKLAARILWKNQLLKNKFTSSVLWEGHLYGLDEDILVCLDAQSGTRRWKEGRYGYGQVLLASGHLIILAGNGDLALVQANPQTFRQVARFPALQGKTWNHPAIESGRLLVRNSAEMACFELAINR